MKKPRRSRGAGAEACCLRRRLEKLATSQHHHTIVSCPGGDGPPHIGSETIFDVGSLKSIRLGNYLIIPHDTNSSFRGIDLYDILERKCGSSHP
jgi:hypothetical protein